MSKRLSREEMREYQRRRRALQNSVKLDVKPCKAPVKPLEIGIDVKPIVKPIGEDSLGIIKRLTEERDRLLARERILEGKLEEKEVEGEGDLFKRVMMEKEARLRC